MWLSRFALAALCLAASACAERVHIPSTYAGLGRVTVWGELHKPDGQGPFPAVVLMHGCQGLASGPLQGLRDHAAFLKQHGYVSLIVDSLGPRSKDGDAVCESVAELAEARRYRVDDAFSTRDFLAGQPYVDRANIFLIGQSNGGSVALAAASESFRHGRKTGPEAFRGVVAYYPWCGDVFTRMIAPVLVLAAEKDDWVPPRLCRDLAAASRGEPIEVVVYEGAYHSFDLPIRTQDYAGHVVGYDAAATRRSREAYLRFFESLRDR